jgi:hypothetical protein
MTTYPVKAVSYEAIRKKKRDYNGKSMAWGGLQLATTRPQALFARIMFVVSTPEMLPF